MNKNIYRKVFIKLNHSFKAPLRWYTSYCFVLQSFPFCDIVGLVVGEVLSLVLIFLDRYFPTNGQCPLSSSRILIYTDPSNSKTWRLLIQHPLLNVIKHIYCFIWNRTVTASFLLSVVNSTSELFHKDTQSDYVHLSSQKPTFQAWLTHAHLAFCRSDLAHFNFIRLFRAQFPLQLPERMWHFEVLF